MSVRTKCYQRSFALPKDPFRYVDETPKKYGVIMWKAKRDQL